MVQSWVCGNLCSIFHKELDHLLRLSCSIICIVSIDNLIGMSWTIACVAISSIAKTGISYILRLGRIAERDRKHLQVQQGCIYFCGRVPVLFLEIAQEKQMRTIRRPCRLCIPGVGILNNRRSILIKLAIAVAQNMWSPSID